MRIIRKITIVLILLFFSFSVLGFYSEKGNEDNNEAIIWLSNPVKAKSTAIVVNFPIKLELQNCCISIVLNFPDKTNLGIIKNCKNKEKEIRDLIYLNGISLSKYKYSFISNPKDTSMVYLDIYVEETIFEQARIYFSDSLDISFNSIGIYSITTYFLQPESITFRSNKFQIFEALP